MAVGTAATIASIASSAIGAGLSFAQASKQKSAMQAAGAKAAQFMADARRRLEVNEMDRLSINKDAYDMQSEDALRANAQALMAITESDPRGLGNVGRVLAQTNRTQAEIRDSLNRDLFNLQAASAEEDSRLRDVNVQLDMQEAAGAAQAEADAQAARQAAIGQGIQGVTSLVGDVIKLPNLYKKTKLGGGGDEVASFLSGNKDFQAPENAKVFKTTGNSPDTGFDFSQRPQMKTTITDSGINDEPSYTPMDLSFIPQSQRNSYMTQNLMTSPFMQQRTRGMVSPVPNQSFSNIQPMQLQNGQYFNPFNYTTR